MAFRMPRSRSRARRARDALAPLVAAAVLVAAAAGADPDVASRPPIHREDAMPGGVSFDARIAEIQRRIQEALVYPALARRRAIEGESEVAFEIGASGRASGIALVRSSGSALLDRAAERAVRDAAPLPPVLGRLRVPVRFELGEREATSR